jgi:hypothetical protein
MYNIFAGPTFQINTEFRPGDNVDVSFGNKHPGVAEFSIKLMTRIKIFWFLAVMELA